jgi:4-amino-4-deoxy-L-arabinose transferase-like glycosyltransferase
MAAASAARDARSDARPALSFGVPVLLVAIGVLAAALRFYGLGHESLWEDEIASVEFARQPLQLLWSDWMLRETNPPLYYSLLHVWVRLFGESEFAVRSLSAVVGCATIPLFYVLGRDFASRRAGLIAALLAAVWPHQVYFGQEARGYILGAAAALVAMIGLLRIRDGMRAEPTRPIGAAPWLLYLGGCLTAVYCHTTNVLLPFLANLYFAWVWLSAPRPHDWRALRAWTATNAALVLAWTWWGWITWRQLAEPGNNINWIQRPSLYDGLNMATSAYSPAGLTIANSPPRLALQLAVTPALLAAAAWGAWRTGRNRLSFVAAFAAGLPVMLFLISQAAPMMLPRVIFWSQAAAIVGLAAAIAAIGPRTWMLAAAAGVAATLSLGRTLHDPKEPWRDILVDLGRRAAPGETVFVAGDGVSVQHYCDRLHCRFRVVDIFEAKDRGRWTAGIFRGPRPRPDQVGSYLQGQARVWTISHGWQNPNPLIAPYATPVGRPFRVAPPDDMTVTAWRPKPAKPAGG